MTEHTFVDADGVTIGYREWTPDGAARATVVIAHGASEHSGRYARVASTLTAAGFSVLAVDHRGHGLTSASTGAGLLGPRGMAGVLDDLDHVVSLATGPVLLLGHSMGSVIALRYAETHPDALTGLVLSGPIGVMPGVEVALQQLQGALDGGLADTPVESLGPFNEEFEPARTPYDWLSRSDAEVDAYVADPWCGDQNPLTYGYLAAVLSGVRDSADEVGRLPSTLPVLVIAGERDPVSAFTAQARALAEAMRSAGLTVTEDYYPGARHELLNETNRAEVEAALVAWLTEHLSPR
ncbi:alpha/beta fold hydrolase [uncultured Jatrophihabitans sp.]|uniref:alpha/beta fold hydrolase n=1 Tax=uncultured Jatrophihabitans sp. TaxID=1610747 RepID=UPI0035CBA5CD